MSKSEKMKSNLRSARKRRSRRLASSGQQSGESQRSPVSTTDRATDDACVQAENLLAESILAVAEFNSSLRDTAVIAALRALQSGTTPKSAEAKQIFDRVVASLEERDIPSAGRRSAGKKMLGLALQSQDRDVPDQFIRYLSLIAV